MCTMLFYPETLPAEKRSSKDSQKAVDRLMAFDRQLSEPFTREELKQLFTQDSHSCLSASSVRAGYEALTDGEKAVVEELGLTPSPETDSCMHEHISSDVDTGSFSSLLAAIDTRLHFDDDDTGTQQALSAEARRRRMKASLIETPNLATEEEVKDLYERMKSELGSTSTFVGGLGFSENHSGQIYVWLDNMNFASGKKGFYYVRYQRSLLWRNTTAYAHPVLIVQKSKLRPDQIEYMERKCRETQGEREPRTIGG